MCDIALRVTSMAFSYDDQHHREDLGRIVIDERTAKLAESLMD